MMVMMNFSRFPLDIATSCRTLGALLVIDFPRPMERLSAMSYPGVPYFILHAVNVEQWLEPSVQPPPRPSADRQQLTAVPL